MKEKILLLCPAFSNYHIAIKSKLIDMGYEVILEDGIKYYNKVKKYSKTHLETRIYSKKILELKKEWNEYLLEKYSKIVVDYLIVIKGDSLNENFLTDFRKSKLQTRFILYQWDSKKAFNYKYLLPYFDSCFSFDSNDCEEDDQLEYLPLFFLDLYNMNTKSSDLTNDLFFVGGNLVITSKTGTIGYNGILNFIKAHTTKSFYKKRDDLLYEIICNNRYSFDFIIDGGHGKYKDIKGFNYISDRISHKEITDRLKVSKVIVDMNTPWQSGLTMRSIETLAAGKKLITTNENVKKEAFFDNRNILIFDPYKTNFSVSEEFVNSDFIATNMNNYSLESFLKRLLS
ncbi:MAG: hypothetical protein EZS26_001271 [Candidatus Ordinivivax streblomastigis]|uniref:Uncharacterized protein n=1 Tax=Candidatus Ordinivivax streblomastigis TaxID=2540710 RepID=A0A5M8P1X4_9BACT|nr:MAG: hypothetical protein EZS26_001271 [Candidatus Ordinivivax streblomastigis]